MQDVNKFQVLAAIEEYNIQEVYVWLKGHSYIKIEKAVMVSLISDAGKWQHYNFKISEDFKDIHIVIR